MYMYVCMCIYIYIYIHIHIDISITIYYSIADCRQFDQPESKGRAAASDKERPYTVQMGI